MIYVLPAMGADSRMYTGPWRQLPGYRFLDWPVYRGEISLAAMAERVIEEYGIGASDIMAGSSLGGMVALEIAKKLRLEKVFLFGSAVDPHEVNPVLQTLAPLIKCTPLKQLQSVAGRFRNLVLSMFGSSDPDFISAMCIAVFRWRGFGGHPGTVRRLHGTRDIIITCRTHCEPIARAGHLIAMTHPVDCVHFLRRHMNHLPDRPYGF